MLASVNYCNLSHYHQDLSPDVGHLDAVDVAVPTNMLMVQPTFNTTGVEHLRVVDDCVVAAVRTDTR